MENDPLPRPKSMLNRRTFLTAAGAGVSAAGAALLYHRYSSPTQAVVVARAEDYDGRLVSIIRDGLSELGFGPDLVAGRSVLLKPNLVEPSLEAPHVNTHPTLIQAAAEAFRRWDAQEVLVAEGQGHCRDSYLVLEQSGLGTVLDQEGIPFVDLNHDEVEIAANTLGLTGLTHFYLPRTLLKADLIVSMPKLKTHHWVGMTLAMKNLFGVIPGICYGWPKNLLHRLGISESILDINHVVRPHLAIVDGIVGMEGDGPIMGTPKRAGLVLMGTNMAAVDATGARLMGLDPRHIPYLKEAPQAGLGPIVAEQIEQRGEPLDSLAQIFGLLDHPQMRQFRP